MNRVEVATNSQLRMEFYLYTGIGCSAATQYINYLPIIMLRQ